MGKVLVINGADFSANAVETISFDGGDTLVYKRSQTGVFFLDYNNEQSIQESLNAVAANTRLYVYKVSAFVGRTVRITSANYVISGAYYDCFASDLGTFSFDDVPTLTGANATSSTVSKKTPITAIDTFSVTSTTTGTKTTITKVIPSGARYLLVSARFDEGLLESEVKAELL